MDKIRTLLVCILVVGFLILGICVYLLFRSNETIVTRPSPTNTQILKQTIVIPFTDYSTGKWDEYGVGIDSDPKITHIWMRKIGYINYAFKISSEQLIGATATLNVRLSSELDKKTSSDPRFSSDVTLSINGVEQQTQNVIPDNLAGQNYTWVIPVNLLKSDNIVTFSVKNTANNKNGISIYSPIQIILE